MEKNACSQLEEYQLEKTYPAVLWLFGLLHFYQVSLIKFNISKKKKIKILFSLAFNVFWFHRIFFLFFWGIFSARQTAIMHNLGKVAYEIPSENREMTGPHFLR